MRPYTSHFRVCQANIRVFRVMERIEALHLPMDPPGITKPARTIGTFVDLELKWALSSLAVHATTSLYYFLERLDGKVLIVRSKDSWRHCIAKLIVRHSSDP
jgi:hypothetical protein